MGALDSTTTVKVKIGIRNAGAERDRIDQLLRGEHESLKVRLDANQSLDLEGTGEWLKWMRARPRIEFLEQPVPVGMERRLLQRFPGDIGRLALDESVVSLPSLTEILSLGWEGWFVVKPALFGSPDPLFALPERVRRRVVLSSAFESGIGFSYILEVARRMGEFGIAHGLGTRGAFEKDGLDGWEACSRFEGTVTSEFLETVSGNVD